jgi:hypothetical protein
MHEWKAVNGRGDLNFLAVQIGSKVYMHELGTDPVSQNLVGTLDLEPFAQGNGVPGDTVLDSSFGEGVMILCNENMDPVLVEFDEDLGTFKMTTVELTVRDFDGIDDGLDTEFRPQNLTIEHHYNLRNQGWPLTATVNKTRGGGNGIVVGDPIELTKTLTQSFFPVGDFQLAPGIYPSNSDIIYAARAPSAKSGNEEVIGSYSPSHLIDQVYGNTPAPKGHYIFGAFNRDRTNVSGIEGLEQFVVTVRPSTTAFYAGRVWYAGVPDSKVVGDVYFSQSLTDVENAGKCHQEADPTAEDLNSLVATDGGVIHIADMGQVHRMEANGQDLMLFAANGVWAVSGSLGGNFQADAFSVRKVTDIGTTARDSVVEAAGSMFYWNQGGIYQISSGQIDDVLTVDRVSRDRIQNFFDEISEAGRAYVRGWYDEYENRIFWFYNDTVGYDGIDFRFQYNRVLALDLTLGAFFPYTLGELSVNSPFVAGMTQKQAGSESIITYEVVQGFGSSQDDVVQGANNVVEDIAFPVFTNTNLKLLTIVQNTPADNQYEYTFSEFNSRTFTDWTGWDQVANNPDNGGADYTSFIQAGWQHSGDTIRFKNISHVTSYFNRTETGFELDALGDVVFTDPSGCLVQTRWEWTDSDNANRWTTPSQAYRYKRFFLPASESDPLDYSFEVIQTKLRMRGKGHAFSIRYEADAGEDTQLLGFAVNIRVVQKV